MALTALENSTYLDFAGYGLTTATTTPAAFGFNPADATASTQYMRVAITLDRANDPTALLNADWATRQTMLAEINDAGGVGTYFGATQSAYDRVVADVLATGAVVLGDAAGTDGYVSSAESRTVWINVDATQFQTLFGTQLLDYTAPDGSGTLSYWNGDLAVSDQWDVSGLWLVRPPNPDAQNLAGAAETTLAQGPQSIGNASVSPALATPGQIADLYHAPLTYSGAEMGTIAILASGVGADLPAGSESFQSLLDAYRARVGLQTEGEYYVVGGATVRPFDEEGGGERSMDVGIVTAVAPQSRIGLYDGSGTFGTYQLAIWDQVNNPTIITSSETDNSRFSPGSPAQAALSELYIDAVLRNITVFNAAGDGGSGNQVANGLANIPQDTGNAYIVQVGGTSLSTVRTAPLDPTLSGLVSGVSAGDAQVIWRLVSGGLTTLTPDAQATSFVEAAWNQYVLSGATLNASFGQNAATTGGVDPLTATPWYQLAYGLSPVSANGLSGRGVPDVAAVGGGDLSFDVPTADMTGSGPGGGTSASAPFWAALTAQFNAIFTDQGLPQLGFYNDLLYTAAAIAPAAFNDVTFGSINTSYYSGGAYSVAGEGETFTPTGFAYEAGEGYDLVSGLGTPNATLLARALSAVAHAQMWFPDVPDVLTSDGGTGWISSVDQNLLFQPSLSSAQDWSLSLSTGVLDMSGSASGSYAWTSRLAQQSLQADFSADIVTLFDSQSQGAVYQGNVAAGDDIGVFIAGDATGQPQAALTSQHGFIDFVSGDGDSAVHVARPVAIAETAGGLDDQTAIVRMRQNGTNDLSVQFYRVDDFSGTVDGVAPGEAGYDQALAMRAYLTASGGTWIDGAGYGQYSQSEIVDVDAGDIIAMQLSSGSHTFYAFASANETVNGQDVGHLWNYGLNTWGWEDLYGGGDLDFNDLVVQLDFTSSSGSGWLV